MVINALEKKPLTVYGTGKNIRDWLYVEDHRESIWGVINDGVIGETYNIGGNCEMENIEVVNTICKVVACELRAEPYEYKNLITFVQYRAGHDFRYALDTSKICKEISWQPKESFESGLRKTIRWYINNPVWIDSVKSGSYMEWLENNYGNRTSKSNQ